MCSPSVPAAPNYAAAAQQTAQGNLAAARVGQYGNMVNQSTPYGNVTYTTLPTQNYINADNQQISADAYARLAAKDQKGWSPLEQWQQNVTLSPEQQALFDQSGRINKELGNVAESGVKYVQDAMGSPIKQTIGIASKIPTTANQMTSNIAMPSLKNYIGDSGNIASAIQNAGNIGTTFDNNAHLIRLESGANELATGSVPQNAQDIQLQSGANELASGDVFNNATLLQTKLNDSQFLQQQTTDALYNANTQFLDPQFQQSQDRLENQLANQGITRGSEAYNNAMMSFNNQKQQAYESARNQAIAGGMNAAQGMFGMNLQAGQFGNQALGQAFGQNVTAQQLQNAAAQQNNQLALANQAAANQALGQQYSQYLQGGQFANQAAQQNNQLALANQAAYNQSLGQQYNQYLGAGNFANQSQAQQFAQNQAAQQAQNEAQAQKFAQNLAGDNFYNQTRLQSFGAGMQNAQLNNQALNQLFGQYLSNAQLQNQASQQDIAQQLQLQQAPVNMLNAVRTGQQLQAANIPQTGVSQPGQLATVSGPDLLSAATAQGQYNQGIYNAQSAANSNLMGSLIGAGGMLGGAGIMKFSDIRLKTNINRIGTHKTLNIGLYLWDYLWGEKGAGVMAQELEKVMPEAVITMPNGFKAVNYSMLGA